jgi:UDP-2,3-diacylglucosamine hydrolase
VGDDGLAVAFPARVAGDLRDTAARVPVYFMHGNRDFLVAERFAAETGVRLLPDPSQVDLYGTPTLLMHGDTLCTDDTQYQAFRATVRDPRWQTAALARPLEERFAIARGMRGESQGAKQAKAMEIMDVAPAAVEAAFDKSGCAVLIHGHTHRPARHVHRAPGASGAGGIERIRWVLPDWYERGGYLEASPGGLRAVETF